MVTPTDIESSSVSGIRKFDRLIAVFFFISGMTGLTYEILWTRLITGIIGAAPFSVSTVLTVFMTGLGIGGYIAGRIADNSDSPGKLIRFYGILEIAVGAYGLLLPGMIILFRPLFAMLYNSLYSQFPLYTALVLTGCALLLLFPAVCMGATLPILSRYYAAGQGNLSGRLGFLYGLNTLGAAAGSLACGFWLIRYLGMWGALSGAVAANIIIGSICFIAGGRETGSYSDIDAAETIDLHIGDSEHDNYPALAATLALSVFCVSGFVSMSHEVIWTRLLGLLVGPTTYSFTIVLVTFISGLALGSMLFGYLGSKTGHPLKLLMMTQILAAVSALVVSHLLGNSQIFFGKLITRLDDSFTLLMLVQAAILFMLMVLPTLFFGATFPLVIKIIARDMSSIGRSVGKAYAVNTVGAVLGAFMAGFVLIPLIGKENSLRFLVALQLGSIAFAAALLKRRNACEKSTVTAYMTAVLIGLILVVPFPRWNRMLLSVGKYQRSFEEADRAGLGWLQSFFFGTKAFEGYYAGDLLYYGDGIGGFTTVKRTFDIDGFPRLSLFNSGKSDASNGGGDMCTQTLLAQFPLLFHPSPDNVLVIGLASGITAGETLHYPLKHLDIVDINRQVKQASRFFGEWNGDVLDDPRSELIIQDGRAHLQLTNRSYDVIISEPSNPWMAGLATLFTKEFFELAKKRLNSGGMYVQWIHSYMIDWDNFALVGRTFGEVFPYSLIVRSGNNADYLLVGFKDSMELNEAVAEKNLGFAQKSRLISLSDHRVFYNLLISEDLKPVFGEGPVNTDNSPLLEFSAPRLMNTYDADIDHALDAGGVLTESSAGIVERIKADTSCRIDFFEYMMSFNDRHNTVAGYVPIDTLTETERKRVADIYVDYCSRHYIADFSFIPDDDIRDACIAAQIEAMKSRVDKTPFKIDLLKHLGKLAYRMDRLDESKEYYRRALEIQPLLAMVHYNLGVIHVTEGNFDEAAKEFALELENNPANIEAINSLGNLNMMKGHNEEAARLYRKALDIDADFYKAHLNLGTAFENMGLKEEAAYHKGEGERLRPKE